MVSYEDDLWHSALIHLTLVAPPTHLRLNCNAYDSMTHTAHPLVKHQQGLCFTIPLQFLLLHLHKSNSNCWRTKCKLTACEFARSGADQCGVLSRGLVAHSALTHLSQLKALCHRRLANHTTTSAKEPRHLAKPSSIKRQHSYREGRSAVSWV